jgi:hypothetical protein
MTKKFTGTNPKSDRTRNSNVSEQGNPYKARATMGRDDETMMRNRLGDFSETPKEREPMPEGTWPAKSTVISGA